jgi:polyvinyl alcohol dehydrogenase (cytochrome)
MWGSATDGERLYVGVANVERKPWMLQGRGAQAGRTTREGLWSALDPRTGAILWQTAEPNPPSPVSPNRGNWAMGALGVANGVVYAGSMAPDPTKPTMFALGAASGRVLWSFASGSSVIAGAAVAGGEVYWGSGYTGAFLQVGLAGSKKLYAFGLR